MKVFIFTEGGRNSGFGHIARCTALYQALEDRKKTPFLIVNADKSVEPILKGKKYEIVNWLKEKGNVFKLVNKEDMGIVDSYLAEKLLYDRLSEAFNGKLLMIDDYNRIEYPSGIVVNPSICGEKINYPKQDGIVYLLGNDYIILRKEFWNLPKKHIKRKIKNVLVTFGGINCSDSIHRIVKYLKQNFNFNAFFPRRNMLTAKEMLSLMRSADLCISAGGQTTYELARVGVPTIGICFAENQRFNLEGWQEKGFIEYIGWNTGQDLFPRLTDAVTKMMPYEERCKRSVIGRQYVDGKGANRIIKTLID